MGMIYKRKHKHPDGTLTEGATWWIKYYRNGIPIRESAETDKESVAKNLLKQREGDIVRGVPITPRTNRVTFDELAADVLTDYETNGKRSVRDTKRHLETHLKLFFSGWRISTRKCGRRGGILYQGSPFSRVGGSQVISTGRISRFAILGRFLSPAVSRTNSSSTES